MAVSVEPRSPLGRHCKQLAGCDLQVVNPRCDCMSADVWLSFDVGYGDKSAVDRAVPTKIRAPAEKLLPRAA